MINLLVFLVACGSEEQATPAPSAEAPAAVEAKQEEPKEEKKTVFFVSPADGATVTSPVKVEMGVEGMTVQAAGEVVEGTGHHHIVIDGAGIDEGTAVPKDATHIHYGDGSTETELELEPGKHTLTLQFANGAHESYGPEWSSTITVEVSDGAAKGGKAGKTGKKGKGSH